MHITDHYWCMTCMAFDKVHSSKRLSGVWMVWWDTWWDPIDSCSQDGYPSRVHILLGQRHANFWCNDTSWHDEYHLNNGISILTCIYHLLESWCMVTSWSHQGFSSILAGEGFQYALVAHFTHSGLALGCCTNCKSSNYVGAGEVVIVYTSDIHISIRYILRCMDENNYSIFYVRMTNRMFP